MEILVTIIAFWLILVGAYGAYSLTQERNRERAPRVRASRPNLAAAGAGASGPFGPVSLPVEKVPSFIARVAPSLPQPELYRDIEEEHLSQQYEEPDRFRAEKIIAARVQQGRVRPEEPVYDEPEYEAPRRQPARQEAPRQEPPRREPSRPAVAHFDFPVRPQATEVDFLRAQVEHLRSEIYALASEQPRRSERPKQRRYSTGNYTHLPRTLRRQVNEVRGRFFSS